MSVTQPPKKKPVEQVPVDEKKVKDFLMRGTTTTGSAMSINSAREFRTIKISMLETEGQEVDKLRQAWPVKRGSKKEAGISQHDWIILAIQEKIERDRKMIVIEPDPVVTDQDPGYSYKRR